MIISHQYRFIFIAVPRTGSHAVREVLRPQLGKTDLEQELLTDHRQMPWPEIANIGHGHIQAKQIKPFLEPDIWKHYFKFAFVRNPWERFISACSYRNPDEFLRDPHQCMHDLMFRKKKMNHFMFRPQTELLLDEKGECIVDYVGRYETFEKDFNHIIKRLRLPLKRLSHVNQSRHLSYKEYYTSALTEAVKPLILRDLEYFGYPDKPR